MGIDESVMVAREQQEPLSPAGCYREDLPLGHDDGHARRKGSEDGFEDNDEEDGIPKCALPAVLGAAVSGGSDSDSVDDSDGGSSCRTGAQRAAASAVAYDDDRKQQRQRQEQGQQQLPVTAMSDLDLKPGQARKDLVVEAEGTLEYLLQLSPSFSFFTLRLRVSAKDGGGDDDDEEEEDTGTAPSSSDSSSSSSDPEFLDVFLSRKDGWHDDGGNGREAASATSSLLKALEQLRGEENPDAPPVTVAVRGHPERMRTKCPTDVDCLRLHATSVMIGGKAYRASLPTPSSQQPEEEEDEAKSSRKNNRGANDSSRFGKMAEFVIKNFGGYDALGSSPLSNGGGGCSDKVVLDVAGGAGGLAFELAVRNAISCVVVDPRPVKYKTRQLRHLEFRKTRLELLADAPKCSTMARNLRNRFQITGFRQIPTLLDASLVLPRDGDDGSAGAAAAAAALRDSLDEPQKQLYDLLHERGRCSVLIGLHPDEATDHIVDIGLALRIPFVVVPCCVFPNFFKQRRLRNGKVVRSYEDLCQFIMEKDPNIKRDTVPFRGRNVALYWHPPPSDGTDGDARVGACETSSISDV